MASFYLNTSATSAISPYSTPDNGAASFDVLISEDLIRNGDVIYVCSDIDVSSAITFDYSVTITSINSTKYNIDFGGGYFYTQCFSSESGYPFIIENLSLTNASLLGPPPGNYSVEPYAKINLDGIYLRNLNIKSQYPAIGPPICVKKLLIENCVFDFAYDGAGFGPPHIIPIVDYDYSDGVSSVITRPESVVIRNNVVYMWVDWQYELFYNAFVGFVDGSGNERTLSTLEIYNNIIYNNSVNRDVVNVNLVVDMNTEDYLQDFMVVENNVIYNKGNFFINYYYPNNVRQTEVSDTNIITNPKLFDVENGNYYIIPTTELYNTGYNNLMVGIGMMPIPVDASESIIVNAGGNVYGVGEYGEILSTVDVSGTATCATSYAWVWDDYTGSQYHVGSSATISVDIGTTLVTLVASDNSGNYNSDSIYAIVSSPPATSATLPSMPSVDSESILRIRDTVLGCSDVNNSDFISLENTDVLRLEFRNNTSDLYNVYEWMGVDAYNVDISATNCQWGWSAPDTSDWQFARGSDTFEYCNINGLSSINQYLLDNKILMKPFDGITYPPNPGYGASAYSVESDIYFDGTVTSAYSEDLFAVSRRKYQPLI